MKIGVLKNSSIMNK